MFGREAKRFKSRLDRAEADLAKLMELESIRALFTRFTRGFDRQDEDLIRSVFWPDAYVGYGRMHPPLLRDDFIAHHLPLHTPVLSYAHHISSQTIEIEGDVAHVESYITAIFRGLRNPGHITSIVGGRYLDRIDRRGGEWRVAVREFIPHFSVAGQSNFDEQFPPERYPREDFWLGTRDRRDPSYRRPFVARIDPDSGPNGATSP